MKPDENPRNVQEITILLEKREDTLNRYCDSKNIRFKTSILGSDLCDYSDEYIVLKGRISVTGAQNASRINKKLIFKNNAPFRSCISKINNKS